MNHTGKRMSECEQYLYILHAVFFTGVAALDKSVLLQTTAWSENNQ
ncbi:hypothetical protein [Planomicrobium sp. CPCC 101110]|nr:hypothetical protein [Planomicrobium sp. CPCC 101110]